MLRGMSWRQFADWVAFDRLEPIGEPRADMRQAALACWIAGAMTGADQLPDLVWPYFDDSQDATTEDLIARRQRHRAAYGYED